MSKSDANSLIPRGPHELRRWSGGLIRRGLAKIQEHDAPHSLSYNDSKKSEPLKRASTQSDPGGNSINRLSPPTSEEMLDDPEILDIMGELGEEFYKQGVTRRAQWHASMYAELEGIAKGLGRDLEPLFAMTWSSVTSEEDYKGGIGGVYGTFELSPKTFKPDYGLQLLRDGISPTVDQVFPDFRLGSLRVLGLGLYSTMVDMPYASEVYAFSLDFGQAHLDSILLKGDPELRKLIKSQLNADPTIPRTLDFEGEISFGVRARLGEPQKVEKEVLVPLVALEILDFDHR